MNIIPTKPGQYVTHCSVDTCKNPVALGLQVEINAYGEKDLQPRIPDGIWSIALFTPCADHIDNTISHLVNLRFNRARIEEISLTQLQKWAGVRSTEGQRPKRHKSTSRDGDATVEDLQRLREHFSKR